jgi:predicted MPP superfamily phosphohydrolase
MGLNLGQKSVGSYAWDLWCLASIIGIWPRFIEPNLIKVTKLKVALSQLPADLEGLRILQFSDLHLSRKTSIGFLKRLKRKISVLNPDIILFTGDFISHSLLEEREQLIELLSSCSAKYGCYAVLGNHDYQNFVSVNKEGYYDIYEKIPSFFSRSLERFTQTISLRKKVTEKAKNVPFHKDLLDLLEKTPFNVLHNENVLIDIKNSRLNICGLGEYMLGKMVPDKAFKSYDKNYPGIILVHNPDALPYIQNYPGNIILCGHTHGFQVNLPWIRNRFALRENHDFVRGRIPFKNKFVYINRGIGSTFHFRWFAPPEILFFTLENES